VQNLCRFGLSVGSSEIYLFRIIFPRAHRRVRQKGDSDEN
jgi:hypothetical protein